MKTSCIIPAYNEGPRIKNVLVAVLGHPMIDEVIVVDDGSSDETSKIVSEFKDIRLIIQPKNMGKSMAIYTGIKEAKGDLIFFLDADLRGLTAQNISALVSPVSSGQADASISLRKVSPILDALYRAIGMDLFSGERVFKKKFLENYIEEIPKLSGFGLETFLNKAIISSGSRLKFVFWDNVSTPLKSEKVGFWRGMKSDMKMARDILKTASMLGLLSQIIKMRRLRI